MESDPVRQPRHAPFCLVHRGLCPALWGLLLVAVILVMFLLVGPLAMALSNWASKGHADSVAAARRDLLASAAGIVVFGTLVFTARTFFLARRGQMMDRQAKAVEQLGSATCEVRIGGLLALKGIALESPRDASQIDEVMADFVRAAPRADSPQRGEWQKWRALPENELRRKGPTPGADVIVAMERLLPHPSGGASRKQAGLADFTGAWLPRLNAKRFKGRLAGTRFALTNLQHLQTGRGQYLRGIRFGGSWLQGAKLHGTDLQGADFGGANLRGADLGGSDLRGADFGGAKMKGTKLKGADLSGSSTNLRGAEELELDQLAEANTDGITRLPKGFCRAPDGKLQKAT